MNIKLTMTDNRKTETGEFDHTVSNTASSFTVRIKGEINGVAVDETHEAEYNRRNFWHKGEEVREEASQKAIDFIMDGLAERFNIEDVNDLYVY